MDMATTKVFALTFWKLENMTLAPALPAAVNTAIPVEWTEMVQANTPADGDLAIVYGYYPNANEYPTLTAATSPALAPAVSRHYLICHKCENGGNYVTDFNEPMGAQNLANLLDWLAVWYPAVRTAVAPQLTAQSTHMQAAVAVATAVNPQVPPFPSA